MINTITPTSSASALSNSTTQASGSSSSTSELISSFKDIMSMMTMMNGGSSYGEQAGSSIGDMMGPLLMIILLEKLVEGQVELDGSADTAQAGTTAQTGTAARQPAKNEPSGRPVGGVLTQNFHPGHNGLDFGVVVGTPVEATMDGKVTYAGWNDQGYGNLVIVENGAYKTYYAHLSSIPVAVGDAVTAGSTVGLSGNTGNSTGPHLHYEIRRNNVAIDPTSVTLGA